MTWNDPANKTIPTSSTASGNDVTFTLKQKYIIATSVLALINVILGIVYLYIRQLKKRRQHQNKDQRQGYHKRRSSSLDGPAHQPVKKYSRKTSTHIVLYATQNKQSARRISTAFL